MPKDRYTATWVSHSSISDFLECPRAYFLKNMYRDPRTKHKVKIIAPPLSLGQAIHEVIESLSSIPTDRRFEEPLLKKLEKAWTKVHGKKGGFGDSDTESKYKKRGEEMLNRVTQNPGPLTRLAVKIQMDLPQYWISEEDNIILCGKIDWLEYIPETKGVHIIDFKTSKNSEGEESLQLPIYHLLAHNCQKYPVEKASYWYLGLSDKPEAKKLPDLEKSHEKILTIAKKIKLARQLQSFKCPQGEKGCRACLPYERILKGEGELVGKDPFGNDIYFLPRKEDQDDTQGVLL